MSAAQQTQLLQKSRRGLGSGPNYSILFSYYYLPYQQIHLFGKIDENINYDDTSILGVAFPLRNHRSHEFVKRI